jgi:hypothetical protein
MTERLTMPLISVSQNNFVDQPFSEELNAGEEMLLLQPSWKKVFLKSYKT